MRHGILALVAMAMLAGCANYQTMALTRRQGPLDTATRSVVLMTIDVARPDGSRYQPNPAIVLVTENRSGDRDQATLFQLTPKKDQLRLEGRSVYLASMALLPGRYRIEGISGVANAFPFHGQFFIPVVAGFELKPQSVSYLGHLRATMRERREGEFAAGSTIPVVEQSITGMVSHTWDVDIEDRYDATMAAIREQIPTLVDVPVHRDPLPAWDRAAAQRLWNSVNPPQRTPMADSGFSSERD